VVHLAAMVGVGQSMYQPMRYMNANSIGTSNLFEILIANPEIKKRIKKIVVASSKSLYGEGAYLCNAHGTVYPGLRPRQQLEKKDWELHCPVCGDYVKPVGITEDKPPQNLSVYALSKYDTERLALMFGDALKISTTAFRYFNVYGPRQSLSNPYTGVCAIFMSRIKNGNSPVVYEDGKQIRDFIYVEDVARANVSAVESEDFIVDAFNVGTGEQKSISDMARTLAKAYDSDVEPKITEEFRAGDNRHDYSDISKIKKSLGFKPKWSLMDGVKKLVEWSESQEAVDKFEYAEKERKKYLGG
jgi:dTDP-L-rhamnose 4-epimerase